MSIILLMVGVILVAVGVVVYIVIGQAGTSGIQGVPDGVNPETVLKAVQYGVSGLVGGLGVLFTLGGLKGFINQSKHRKLVARLMQTGTDAEGTVTFVDKNFRILVNHQPIYSIVEYTFQDASGNEHTRRIDRVNSEAVVRSQIQVGTKIPVKYDPQDPNKNIMVMQTP